MIQNILTQEELTVHPLNFISNYGDEYRIIGIQSCGDLTMNPWHVAFIHGEKGDGILCRLATLGDPDDIFEPFHERVYRCLVKWNSEVKECKYEFIGLKFVDRHEDGFRVIIADEKYVKDNNDFLKEQNISNNDISDLIEFALSGKPIVQKGKDITLSNVIDSFQDVRHIFNLPTVPAYGAKGKLKVKEIQFGEYELFKFKNARRCALNYPILVDLEVPELKIHVDIERLEEVLENKHYRKVEESPARKGEYRQYSEKTIEIFFPHNVYPFGVIGGKPGQLVCLSSGGLSGRVGTTIGGIIRIMYDFFGCEDALVLDEGYDTFHILNPKIDNDSNTCDAYKYSNDEILRSIASFTLWRLEEDFKRCRSRNDCHSYKFGSDMAEWPLNKKLFEALYEYCKENQIKPTPQEENDIMAVRCHRSQIRAVIIFAVPENHVKNK